MEGRNLRGGGGRARDGAEEEGIDMHVFVPDVAGEIDQWGKGGWRLIQRGGERGDAGEVWEGA